MKETNKKVKSIYRRMKEVGKFIDTEGLQFDGDVGVSSD